MARLYKRSGGVVSGAITVGTRLARRSPVALLLLLVPLVLTVWALLNPFAAAQYLPTWITRHWGGAPTKKPIGSDGLQVNGGASVLLVSAYFPLGKSKHSWLQYYNWISNFYGQIQADLYVFVPPEMGEVVHKIRGPNLPLHVNTTFAWAHEIPPLQHLQREFAAQVALDPEAYKHNAELYQVWAAKPYFVREAMRNLRATGRREYDYVLWIDAGSMRETHPFAAWPDVGTLDRFFEQGARLTGTPRNDLILIPIERNIPSRFAKWQEDDGPLDALHDLNTSEGSLFGGSPHALEWYIDIYFTYLYYYLDMGLFVGKDQSIMNTLFVLYPERFITIWNRDPRAKNSPGQQRIYGGMGYCGDPWFYYFFVMATEAERIMMNRMWQAKWRIDYWNGPRHVCRTTGILAMDDVLRVAFGKDWRPPPHRLRLKPLP
ncbi:hypothetical protein BKA62DRAFT_680509 [Auriculariales sp. MPI-PUGE-AT-0066]|nr:hypothetical protein BKA62DRAFT_680509 [Auriculariales sp. MPI-PUGE-AT-0066]